MLVPEVQGNQLYYDISSKTEFSTSEIAAIDSNISGDEYYPYAWTSTVNDELANYRYYVDNSVDLVAGSRVAFGIFLAPDVNKDNMLINIEGAMAFYGDSTRFNVYPILGTTVSSTITSSKAAQSNQLACWKVIPCETQDGAGYSKLVSFNKTVLAVEQSSVNTYCLAWVISNHEGSTRSLEFNSNLSMRAWTTPINYHRPGA
ncbi:hypothetical protein [Eel River basin pequenovirus]|uniref:hypothetical protein n=1 Tax=Eel River basin pequenovirus TaxID=1609634 RepID=UPI0005B23BF8|nr:hypothetical protein [Eel River basin pequenovirus]AJK28219.1 hypothetical protein [Eel River basin pequenovirus]